MHLSSNYDQFEGKLCLICSLWLRQMPSLHPKLLGFACKHLLANLTPKVLHAPILFVKDGQSL